MGTIYRRGKTLWIKYSRHGRPYHETTRGDIMTEARRLLKEREGEIAVGKMPGKDFEKVFFDELAESFLNDYVINGYKSLFRAKISVKHLARHFEGYRATEVTTGRIQAYIKCRLGEGAAHATVNLELSALKRMFTLGARQTPPKVDRVPYIPMLKVNNARQGFFEHGDFLALRDALPAYLKGFVTFAYKSGWRLSEIRNLTWNQVDLKKGIAWLEAGTTKNDEGRTLYLDPELQEVLLNQWKNRKKSGVLLLYVFPNRDNTGKIIDIRKAWKTGCKKAEIGERLFHDFRRTAVRNMVRAVTPERVVMTVSGHKTRQIFERYNIVDDKDLKKAADQYSRYLEMQDSYKKVTIKPFPAKKEASQNS